MWYNLSAEVHNKTEWGAIFISANHSKFNTLALGLLSRERPFCRGIAPTVVDLSNLQQAERAFFVMRVKLSEEEIRAIHNWYIKDYDRTLVQAGEIVGMSGPGLGYRFKRLGLFVKPKRKPLPPTVTLVCEWCKTPFVITKSSFRSRQKQGSVRFCSRKCSGEASQKEGTHITLNCDYCDNEFSKRRDHLTSHNYCSKKCSDLGRQNPSAKWNDPVQIKAYMKDYQQKNKVALNKKKSEYAAKHKENKLEYQRRYRQNNKEYIAFVARVRKQKIYSADFDLSEWEEIKKLSGYACLCCGKKEPDIKLEMDHVIPLALGGVHHLSNVQPLCRSCNSRKGKKHIDYRSKVGKR